MRFRAVSFSSSPPPARTRCSSSANGFSGAVANGPKPSASKSVRAATAAFAALSFREELRTITLFVEKFWHSKAGTLMDTPHASGNASLDERGTGETPGRANYSLTRREFQLAVQGFPVSGRERNVPEAAHRHVKLHRDQRALWSVARRACDAARRTFAGAVIPNFQFHVCGQCSRAEHHGAVVVDRNSFSLNGEGLTGDGDIQRYRRPHHDSLAAPPFLARENLLHGVASWLGFRHSSSPQKSIFGSMSSMPSSQPSARSFPFHTTMAGLLWRGTKLVSTMRCSSSSLCGRTMGEPQGPPIRVCAFPRQGAPASPCHSSATRTREFSPPPRLFSFLFR